MQSDKKEKIHNFYTASDVVNDKAALSLLQRWKVGYCAVSQLELGRRYFSVGETQIRFNCWLEITRVQLTCDLTFVGETGP